MRIHDLAGKPPSPGILIDAAALINAYYTYPVDVSDPTQRVSFGTSGHRGSSLTGSFNEAHILAITQAICLYRQSQDINGPLFMGKDTHALSGPAQETALEVLAANGVDVLIQEGNGFTPTPVISHAILSYNRARSSGLSDGIVVTPSHNPPEDGGFKYDPPEGGPADTIVTDWIAKKANELLENGNAGVRRMPYKKALRASTTREHDYAGPYIDDLVHIIDLQVVSDAKPSIGADALGGSGFAYWERIAQKYGLQIDVLDAYADPTFSFMTLDHDGKIRMDCSSPYAMARLIGLKDKYDIAFGNDPDFDRHGIVTRSAGLMNPNHYLSVAIHYLFSARKGWPQDAAIGKTLVSSTMIDHVAHHLGRRLYEVPVGFKWFVECLITSRCGFGGEESAGASFLKKDGTVWTTDKDGFIMDLLAAEILATTGKDPAWHYRDLEEMFGISEYERIDAPANDAQKALLKKISPDMIEAELLAGEPIIAKTTDAPGNCAPIGGIKVVARSGWFAARPSGTEDIYKIYAESFMGTEHLKRIEDEAQAIIGSIFERAGV
ncbi:MAG TPA: phosphoglucomutase (alpha-D-glucose-1,6-bisphosphate-dependent) [Deltaproteobacteria bacterium]|mgnify:CR=1 FL=1|jgi:phosphoglucomutase|nr:phosphoglucomutase (alpha-D-glucose-1,6-bisphosphate-dependent) [Deltaproteobacteria bacterium]HQJ07854.1 phosphoglucomutase (alpha-D-glucose-1,6-bisphosphate-dependent) [Deltaproteobacteria bacterium]